MAKDTDAKILVKKDENFSEWFTELMKKAELADVRYPIKGFPVYRPWAVRSIKKIRDMWEKELEARGHEPVIFPLLIPESFFSREADHVEGFTPDVFWVTHGGSKEFEERYALRPTSETAIYEMFGQWIQSYNDLPMKTYQSVNVFRYESKMTRPFMRTRELHWTEAHNVFATEEEAYADAKENLDITHKLLFEKLAIPHIFFKRPQWDKFPGAINTFAADVLLQSGKVLQLPSSHMISQKFSKAFNVTFIDKDEQEKMGWITCYGPCHSRNYGALITFHGDDKGLRLPWDIAPKHIVIVPLLFKGKEDIVLEKAKELELMLKGYDIIVDTRSDATPGFKFNHWEMKGVPIRIEVGPRDIENKQVMVYRRDTEEKTAVPLEKLTDFVADIRATFTKNLKEQAVKAIAEKTKDATKLEDIKKFLEDGNMVRTCIHSIDMDGAEVAETVEKELGAEIRGESFEKQEKIFCDCPFTGKPAKHVVYIAKSH
ncbi:MAG: proline--tRNA ligase [Candidatus Woesearchaeota archaeon]